MPKAIIFDCFGVLATEAWLPFKAKYFGHDPELFERASSISRQASQGEIGYADFMQEVADLAGITAAEATQAIARNVPDEQLFDYIRELKPSYKLGLLSNIASNRLHQIFTDQQLGLFDAIALSFEHGFIKPQRQAFEIAAHQLNVELDDCIFIDDQPRNVNGAQEAGMKTILYQNCDQLRQELSKILADSKG